LEGDKNKVLRDQFYKTIEATDLSELILQKQSDQIILSSLNFKTFEIIFDKFSKTMLYDKKNILKDLTTSLSGDYTYNDYTFYHISDFLLQLFDSSSLKESKNFLNKLGKTLGKENMGLIFLNNKISAINSNPKLKYSITFNPENKDMFKLEEKPGE